jgi:hypothetical protein
MPSLKRILILSALALFLAGPAGAADILQASVAVDATAQSASQAREKALQEGQQQAFRRLLESMTVEADRARLPHPNNWQDWLVDISVDQEKSSAVRYLAILTVRFKAQPVRALLKNANIPFAETPSKPVLVVPVFIQSGRGMLWDEDNLWLKAWQERPKMSTLAPVLAPVGDNWDRQAYDVGSSGDRLDSLGKRYGAVQTILAEARPSAAGLDVRLTYPNGQIFAVGAAMPKEASQSLYRRAADQTALQIEEVWKRQNLVSHETTGVLLVTVAFNGLSDWLKIREKIERIALIRRHEVLELARSQASLALYHAGDLSQLRTAFSQADLVLTTDSQGASTLALSPAVRR